MTEENGYKKHKDFGGVRLKAVARFLGREGWASCQEPAELGAPFCSCQRGRGDGEGGGVWGGILNDNLMSKNGHGAVIKTVHHHLTSNLEIPNPDSVPDIVIGTDTDFILLTSHKSPRK